MDSLLAPDLCLLCAIAAPVASPGLSPAAPIRTVYFTAADASGEPVRGLKADDLSLSENGLPRPILELKESPDHLEGRPMELRRLFVVYFDDDLTLRQLFRARRWLLKALPELRPNDGIAVYRSPRLSAFKSRRSAMRDLVRYLVSSCSWACPPVRLILPPPWPCTQTCSPAGIRSGPDPPQMNSRSSMITEPRAI